MISLDSFYNIDTWAYLLRDFLLALSISALSAFSGVLFMSFVCLAVFQKKRLGVYGKGARQLATLGLIFGWGLLVVIRIWLYFFPEKLLEYCWMAMAGAVLLQSLHFSYWKSFSKSHLLFQKYSVLLNALLAATTAIPIIFLVRSQLQDLFPSGMKIWGVLQPFLSLDMVREDLSYFHIASIALSVFMAFSAPAAWGAVLLPFFRKHQDFGRDHYKTLVVWLSRWARNAWLYVWTTQCILTLAGTWFLWQEAKTSTIELVPIAFWQIVWLLPALLWAATCRSGQPLRHRLSLFLAALISISLF